MKKMLLLVVMSILIMGTVHAAAFAKYDGIDGESKDANHNKWIDVLSIDWGMHKPGGGATGQSRRRGNAVIEDMTMTIEYEKASPKLQEALLMGKVIPKVEIELTDTYGGARATYLKYELKNVRITSYSLHSTESTYPVPDETTYMCSIETRKPIEVYGTNFEEIKVTYTEYDTEGNKKGNVEYQWKVEEGE